jgi:hypothetical protein
VLQVLQCGGDRAALQRRDRPNYGPYLLLLSAEDMAHITLQSELAELQQQQHCPPSSYSSCVWLLQQSCIAFAFAKLVFCTLLLSPEDMAHNTLQSELAGLVLQHSRQQEHRSRHTDCSRCGSNSTVDAPLGAGVCKGVKHLHVCMGIQQFAGAGQLLFPVSWLLWRSCRA